MPRLARMDAPGVLHHVTIRGVERRRLFRDNQDRENFLNRLEALLPETQTDCYAWALIPNHAHFLFKTGGAPLSTLMRRLLTGYAVTFNRRHKRHGQVFQNRYKSIVCQEEIYLLEMVRYIHLNPIRAGLVSDLTKLDRYPYCGHSALMGEIKRPWQTVQYVLRYFRKTVPSARKAYMRYLEEGVDQGHREDLIGGGLIRSLGGWTAVRKAREKGLARGKSDERILGEPDFVEEILAQSGEHYERGYDLVRRGYDLNRIVDRVAEILEMEPDQVLSKGRQREKVVARSLLCFWAVRELGLSLTELAPQLEMTVPGIGYAVQRGELIVRENDFRLVT